MITSRRLFTALCLMVGLSVGSEAPAQDAATSEAAASAHLVQGVEYTEKGADTCIKCHDEDSEYPVFSIFKTKHARRADSRTPFAKLQCEGCHGPGANHSQKIRPGEKRPPIMNFGAKTATPSAQQNKICLDCHTRDSRIGWKGSAHETNDVACASCHRVHAPRDPVLTENAQPETCYACHLKQRADFLKPSVHPVRFGVLPCSECHNTHASVATRSLNKPTLNQTCYQCHAEKRGPFLWEHAPVAEDCSLCHVPHGSIHPALLTKRAPLLCQQCHSQAGHPSVAYTGAGLPSGTPSGFLLAGSCLNCHSQVHGSNHPSGVKLMR
ncbi:MAG: DmsE family decaheme c-type cytochrome [Pseudomonadota bacterium]|nr:MAG: DmsE family decaheme c-type cytochrome [Pseudomonadota bacterium]